MPPRLISAVLLALCLSLTAWGAPVRPVQGPSSGGIDVGLHHAWYSGSDYIIDITFGGVPATQVRRVVTLWDADTGEPRVTELHCTVPPHVAGTVDVVVSYTPVGDKPPRPSDVLPGAFTYLGAPVLKSISPSQFTFKNDQRTCKIRGTGFPLDRAPKVLFGGHSASEVTVNGEGTELTVTPPPFPGGPIPLVVDVSVVAGDGTTTTLSGAFSYTRLSPNIKGINGAYSPAWQAGFSVQIVADYFTEGVAYGFVGGYLLAQREKSGHPDDNAVTLVYPAFPPGYYDLRIVNGDGGETVLKKSHTHLR